MRHFGEAAAALPTLPRPPSADPTWSLHCCRPRTTRTASSTAGRTSSRRSTDERVKVAQTSANRSLEVTQPSPERRLRLQDAGVAVLPGRVKAGEFDGVAAAPAAEPVSRSSRSANTFAHLLDALRRRPAGSAAVSSPLSRSSPQVPVVMDEAVLRRVTGFRQTCAANPVARYIRLSPHNPSPYWHRLQCPTHGKRVVTRVQTAALSPSQRASPSAPTFCPDISPHDGIVQGRTGPGCGASRMGSCSPA